MAKLGGQLELILTPIPDSGAQIPPGLDAYEELEQMLVDYEAQQRQLCLQRCRTASELIEAEWELGETPNVEAIEAIIFTVCFQ